MKGCNRLALPSKQTATCVLLDQLTSQLALYSATCARPKQASSMLTMYLIGACCRVLERYPANGRLLKIYGRFLEYIRHDPWTASKFYAEALKQGTSESLINLARGQGGDGALAQAGSVNEKVDGVIVINAHGSILMLNPAAMAIFGYDKGELEGKNVSVLM